MALQIDFQYDLFEPKPSEFELLKLEVEKIKLSSDKVRKGAYSAIGELKKRVFELEERLQIIERHICR